MSFFGRNNFNSSTNLEDDQATLLHKIRNLLVKIEVVLPKDELQIPLDINHPKLRKRRLTTQPKTKAN